MEVRTFVRPREEDLENIRNDYLGYSPESAAWVERCLQLLQAGDFLAVDAHLDDLVLSNDLHQQMFECGALELLFANNYRLIEAQEVYAESTMLLDSDLREIAHRLVEQHLPSNEDNPSIWGRIVFTLDMNRQQLRQIGSSSFRSVLQE